MNAPVVSVPKLSPSSTSSMLDTVYLLVQPFEIRAGRLLKYSVQTAKKIDRHAQVVDDIIILPVNTRVYFKSFFVNYNKFFIHLNFRSFEENAFLCKFFTRNQEDLKNLILKEVPVASLPNGK